MAISDVVQRARVTGSICRSMLLAGPRVKDHSKQETCTPMLKRMWLLQSSSRGAHWRSPWQNKQWYSCSMSFKQSA